MPDAIGVQDGVAEAQGAADGQAVGSARSKHRVRRSRSQERTLLVITCSNCLIMNITWFISDHFDSIPLPNALKSIKIATTIFGFTFKYFQCRVFISWTDVMIYAYPYGFLAITHRPRLAKTHVIGFYFRSVYNCCSEITLFLLEAGARVKPW